MFIKFLIVFLMFFLLKNINKFKTFGINFFCSARMNVKKPYMAAEAAKLFPLSVYYVTVDTQENAKKIATALLEKKLIACSNIIGTKEAPITSLYTWKGKVESDNEVLMVIKSRTELVEEITKTVKENHPYEVPEVIAMPIIAGHSDYIDWMYENTKEPNLC